MKFQPSVEVFRVYVHFFCMCVEEGEGGDSKFQVCALPFHCNKQKHITCPGLEGSYNHQPLAPVVIYKGQLHSKIKIKETR